MYEKAKSIGFSLFNSAKRRAVVAVATLAAGVSVASAGGSTPPTMPAIELPVDVSSVASAIAFVGGTMLLAWGGIYIGFKLARKFITRAGGTV